MKNRLNGQKGITFIEIVLFFGVLALVLIMSVKYYGIASEGYRVNGVISQIQSITSAAHSLYDVNYTYESALNVEALKRTLGEEKLRTSWGTEIQINNVTKNNYEVVLPAMPASICIKVKSRMATMANFYTGAFQCPQQGNVDYTYTYYNEASENY